MVYGLARDPKGTFYTITKPMENREGFERKGPIRIEDRLQISVLSILTANISSANMSMKIQIIKVISTF